MEHNRVLMTKEIFFRESDSRLIPMQDAEMQFSISLLVSITYYGIYRDIIHINLDSTIHRMKNIPNRCFNISCLLLEGFITIKYILIATSRNIKFQVILSCTNCSSLSL